MGRPLDVVGIGNALVDVICPADDCFIESNGLVKGAMTLIDAERAEQLYSAMGPGVFVSGGSAANTMAGLASLGGQGGFIGRVRDDQFGEAFIHDIRAAGLEFDSRPARSGPPTGRCLIVVTPDAQRTMNTYLGASSELSPDDVPEDMVARAAVTYLEGYLFDRDLTKEAFEKATSAAHAAGGRVALTLSDSYCVERFRPEFQALVRKGVDVLFANIQELCALYEEPSADAALAQAEQLCEIVILTRGAAGSTIASEGKHHDVEAVEVGQVIDTTGAGDLYAAGFLHGLTTGLDLRTCGLLGSLAAAEIISHMGARPETVLSVLATRFL